MSSFPTDQWLEDMKTAIAGVIDQGKSLLAAHRRANERATVDADRWQLAERLEEEEQMLFRILGLVRGVVEAIESSRETLRDPQSSLEVKQRMLSQCAGVIENAVPGIEQAFLLIRRSAQDLLQWTQRSGKIAGSQLPEDYRSSYAKLIAYSPVFQPMLEAFQEELLELSGADELRSEAESVVSAVNRYSAVIDSARAFVRSVIDPPLELVFHETQSFEDDRGLLPSDRVAIVATEVNDCCQQLLYDPSKFRELVQHLRPVLEEGIESSLNLLRTSTGFSILFTVDEDPVFGQLVVTLMRVVDEDRLDDATTELMRALYEPFTSDVEKLTWQK